VPQKYVAAYLDMDATNFSKLMNSVRIIIGIYQLFVLVTCALLCSKNNQNEKQIN
jgi:glucose uptake protein GlcU